MASPILNVRLTPTMMAELRELADKDGVNLSEAARRVLEQVLKPGVMIVGPDEQLEPPPLPPKPIEPEIEIEQFPDEWWTQEWAKRAGAGA